MSSSLKDQLMGLGFKPVVSPKPAPRKSPAQAKPQHTSTKSKSKPGAKPDNSEFDLGKAYALRQAQEKREKAEAERQRQEEARQRREAKLALEQLLKDKVLNQDDAAVVRHFNYGNKIRRIYVTEDQLKALNAAELGVVQLNGRYLLVSADTLAQAERVSPAHVALKVTPGEPSADDEYADPKYQVPDDLQW